MSMKLLIFTHEYPPFPGGVANYVHGIVNAAAALGHDLVVATVKREVDAHGKDASQNVEVREVFRSKGSSPIGSLGKLISHWRIIHSLRDHQLHCFDWISWKQLTILNILFDYPYELTLYGSEIISTKRSLRRRILRDKLLFRNLQKITFISVATAELFDECFPGMNHIPRSIAYPGINPELIPYIRMTPKAIKEDDEIRLLTVARIEARKGHLETVQALMNVELRLKNKIRWTVAGKVIDYEYERRVREEASKLRMHVHFAGEVDIEQLADLYDGSDIFLLPGSKKVGRWEGFGIVFIEAGAFGLPSISTRWGGIPEAVIDGETGLLCQPDNPIELADLIIRMIRNPDERTRLGKGAKLHAEKFSWEAAAKSTFNSLNNGGKI